MPNDRGVLVVDFGAQYAQLIARRVREAHVYSEIIPSTITAAQVREKNPSAIILSGGPSSVYAENAPQFDAAMLKLGIPVFGICYGFQVMAAALGGVLCKSRCSLTLLSFSCSFLSTLLRRRTVLCFPCTASSK